MPSLTKFLKIPALIFSFFIFGLSYPAIALAQQGPFLAFSDLISGPATGLGDNEGSGVIVTVWGQNLGSTQGNSQIYYTDAKGVKRKAAKVYYWKNADGKLPSGPANLYTPMKMQEIAFSIPDSASGSGDISVQVNGVSSNTLPFTVRPGNIYFVKSNGSDSSGNGSWKSPWATIGKADSTAPAGSTIYVLGVDTGSDSSARGIYWNDASASSTLSAQYAIIAYPGYHPTVTAQRAVENYKTQGLVVSKLDLYASNYTSVDSYGQPTGTPIDHIGMTFGIQTSKNGREVANRVGDIPGGCASEEQGAITGNARGGDDRVSNAKILGNEIHDYGCNGTSKFHHTTYMSVRSGTGLVVQPWEFAYNYLHGNKAKFGIHNYDEGTDCGDISGPIKIINNVIVDQAGAGIDVGSDCGWSMNVDIENNVLINVGLAAAWDGKNPDSSNSPENGGISFRDSGTNGLTGTMYVRNNLIYDYTSDGQTNGARGCIALNGNGDSVKIVWTNNICYTSSNEPFIGYTLTANNKLDNISGSNNAWYDSGNDPSSMNVPTWDAHPITSNPLIDVSGASVMLEKGSPLIDAGAAVPVTRDVYGDERASTPTIGPVAALFSPPSSPVLQVK